MFLVVADTRCIMDIEVIRPIAQLNKFIRTIELYIRDLNLLSI